MPITVGALTPRLIHYSFTGCIELAYNYVGVIFCCDAQVNAERIVFDPEWRRASNENGDSAYQLGCKQDYSLTCFTLRGELSYLQTREVWANTDLRFQYIVIPIRECTYRYTLAISGDIAWVILSQINAIRGSGLFDFCSPTQVATRRSEAHQTVWGQNNNKVKWVEGHQTKRIERL